MRAKDHGSELQLVRCPGCAPKSNGKLSSRPRPYGDGSERGTVIRRVERRRTEHGSISTHDIYGIYGRNGEHRHGDMGWMLQTRAAVRIRTIMRVVSDSTIGKNIHMTLTTTNKKEDWWIRSCSKRRFNIEARKVEQADLIRLTMRKVLTGDAGTEDFSYRLKKPLQITWTKSPTLTSLDQVAFAAL